MAFGLDDALAGIFGLSGKLIDRLWPDPAERAKAQLELAKLNQSGELQQMATEAGLLQGQLDINKVEAASQSLFVAGWRPAVGWICAGGLGYQVIFRPIFSWIMQNLAHWTPAPSLEMETLTTILFGMLGLAGMRSFEKVRGVTLGLAPK